MAKYTQYNARAIKHDWARSKNKGTPYLEVIFEATDGSNAQFPWQGYFTEATTERTIESLKLCGCSFPGGDVRNLTGFDKNVVSISVEDTEYGARVAWVNAPGSVTEQNRLAGAELDSFAQRMKGTILALAQRKPAGPKPAAAPTGNAPWDGTGAAPSSSEADIPF